MEVGETLQLTATVSPDNADDKTVTWSSSDDSIATVDQNGLVTAKAEGKVVITATNSAGQSANCMITVKAASTDNLSLIHIFHVFSSHICMALQN